MLICLNKFLRYNITYWNSSRRNMSKRLKLELCKTKVTMVNISNSNNNSQESLKSSSLTYLSPPIKSEQDKKEYSVIKLSNGLTALLISDIGNMLNINDLCQDESSSESESENSETEEEDSGDELSNTINSNENKKGEKIASCALCVGVGSFSDPDHIQGLAHFLEHMIFMGSSKYPLENEYDNFIKKKGGSDNASTECEYTTFYFDCNERHLHEAMDIFSHTFISPLMKKESMQREREAIEAEFQMAVPSDSNRRSQLICSTAHPENPVRKFMWGNLKTLCDSVDDNDLYESVHEFKNRHYSAHRMTLAVQARLPIKTLESWVVECFSAIPNNKLPPDIFKVSSELFLQERFCKLYIVDPVKNDNNLRLSWIMPPTINLYKSKPLYYINSLIGYEGKGSLSSYLQKKLWALDVTSSTGEDGTELNSLFTMFSISISLTEIGLKYYKDVIYSVFQFIKLLQNKGPNERIYKELQLIENIGFRFKEEVDSSDYVENLVEQMQVYPSTDYITGSDLYFEYNPDIIQEFLDRFKPDAVNIMLSSKSAATNVSLDHTEPWFGTKYNVADIPDTWTDSWANVNLLSDFHLPDPNSYITTDFSLLPMPSPAEEHPTKIYEDDVVELWHKQDITFKLPTAVLCMQLISPLPQYSPQNSVLQDLMIAILAQILVEEVYPANIAHLQYSLSCNEKGLVIIAEGFNEKLNNLLQIILKAMKTLNSDITVGLFNAVKEDVRKNYYNSALKSRLLAREIRMSILLQYYWTVIDKQNAISNISFERFKEFSLQYFEYLNIQFLFQGNISKENSINICLECKENLKCKPLLLNTIPDVRVCQFPIGKKYCRALAYNVNDVNSVVTNYYQSGAKKMRDHCLVELLLLIMQEPLFDTLRTKEQLGYDISCCLRDTFGILGFSISVSFQIDKFSLEHIESRITLFLNNFLETISAMPNEEFEEYKETLIKTKQYVDVQLKEEVKRNWSELQHNEYIFDRMNREKQYIEELTLQEVVDWAQKHICERTGTNFRKLSVQIEGNQIIRADKENSVSETNGIKEETFNVNNNSVIDNQIINPLCLELKFQGNESIDYISNISNYKKSLELFHINKVD